MGTGVEVITFIEFFDWDASGNLIYRGWAIPGSSSSQSRWRIAKYAYDASNNLTSGPLFAGGIPSFSNVWNDRTSYSYS